VISNQSVGVVGTGQVNTNILDDDRAWSISPASASNTEGTTRTYSVSYTGATLTAGQTATITVATGNNNTSTFPNAIAGADYTAVSTVLTFTSGTGTQRTIAVSTIQDTIVETTEDYLVTISGQSTGTVAASQANGTIVDNDATSLQWNITGTASLNEGATGSYSVSYTGVTLAPGQTQTITVATGNATGNTITNATGGGVDYTSVTTVLTFTGGSATQKTVAVSTIDDTLNEAEEDYGVSLSGPSIGSIGTGSVTTVINFSDVSATFKVNEVSVGASVTAPGGVATDKWIELQNTAGTAQLSTGVSLEILGATGGIKTIAMPAVSVPAGGYLVIYEQGANAIYGVYNSAGGLLSSGAIAAGGGWNFGSDTSQRVGVNVFAGSTSFDLFLANGAGTGSFSGGASGWTSPGLTGAGFAAAAGLLATPYPLLSNQTAYNGQVDSQTALLQRLGLRSGSTATNNDVFLRGDTTDNSNGTDWTTATNAADTAGTQNNAAGYINPNDPSETITHSQATATVGEGQQFLEVTTGTGTSLDGLLGHDFLYGNTGNDTLIGGGGDDFLFGHSGNDRLFGGPGGDVLIDVSGTVGNGDYMEGGSGHDILLGTYNGSANTVGMVLVGDVSLVNSSNGNDWISGGNGGDIIIGDNINFAAFSQTTFLNNPFAAGQGTVAFNARGGTGNDTVFGRGGSDLIGTSGGNDSVFGDDPLNLAVFGNDTIATDDGNDYADGGPGSDSINLGSGFDQGFGGSGNDTIDGESGGDAIEGESGDDLLFGSGGGDQIYGDSASNTTSGNDTIFSGFDGDFAAGGSGDDLIFGEQGADWLDGDLAPTGAGGSDTLHGGTQDDTLVGGPGLDLYGLDGSSGVLFDFANAAPAPGGWQTMNLTPYGLGVDWFREMEGVAGSGGSDTIFDGIGGGQYYQGGGGNDEYHDGEGQDTYDMSGGPADHDTLSLDAVSLTAVPNTVIGFGQTFDGVGPDTGNQDYIDLDAIFDAFGVATVDRAGRVQINDPPGFGPVSLEVDVDGPGIGTFVTLIIFEGIGSGGGFSFGNAASDDIQVGTL
ncbi:MAG: Calx-beta domain-containing protein, partial [Dongiaceae bacterium]